MLHSISIEIQLVDDIGLNDSFLYREKISIIRKDDSQVFGSLSLTG